MLWKLPSQTCLATEYCRPLIPVNTVIGKTGLYLQEKGFIELALGSFRSKYRDQIRAGVRNDPAAVAKAKMEQ